MISMLRRTLTNGVQEEDGENEEQLSNQVRQQAHTYAHIGSMHMDPCYNFNEIESPDSEIRIRQGPFPGANLPLRRNFCRKIFR